MEYKNQFEDGEKVLWKGEIVTVKEWSYITNMRRYAYTIEENPSSFWFEDELEKIDGTFFTASHLAALGEIGEMMEETNDVE